MITKPKTPVFFLAIFLVVAACVLRLLDGPPNFSPIAAIGLFGGAYYRSKVWAFTIPLLSLFFTDLIIGIHPDMLAVYGGVCFSVFLGFGLGESWTGLSIAGRSLIGSVVFFFLTNTSVWITSGMYESGVKGLLASYVAGIPFFHWTVLGDLFYSGILFGSAYAIKRFLFRIPRPGHAI